MRAARFLSLHIAVAGAALLLASVVPSALASNPFAKFAGIYSSASPDDSNPSAPAGPTFSVSLGADGTATVTQDTGKGTMTNFGHWADTGSQITVKFDTADGQPTEAPMVFQPAHDGLEAVTWNHTFWGKLTPPPLKKEASNWHTSKKHNHT